jgi:cytoplasmic iron level regulating protein YaaA (DUF328/UPF0246 family)
MKRIVIIPCGGAKLTEPAPAAELYTGSMFKDTLRTALTMTDPENVLILSALHGLVTLDTVLEPYDLRMGHKWSVSASKVNNQLNAFVPRNETFIIDALLPKAYMEKLEEATDMWVENYFDGCKGIGYQKQVLSQLRGRFAA